MQRLGTSFSSQTSWRQVDGSVSAAQTGDLIEFVTPWTGASLWGVYVGDGRVLHFGVGDENMTQKACRSLLQQLSPRWRCDGALKRTRISTQLIADIKVPLGTRIRVNNSQHRLVPSPEETVRQRCHTLLHQEFNYDLLTFNSEHFATFIRYGRAVSRQFPLWGSGQDAGGETTQALQMIMDQRTETEI